PEVPRRRDSHVNSPSGAKCVLELAWNGLFRNCCNRRVTGEIHEGLARRQAPPSGHIRSDLPEGRLGPSAALSSRTTMLHFLTMDNINASSRSSSSLCDQAAF